MQFVLLSLYLSFSVIDGLHALGIQIITVPIYPLKKHATLINALLVNCMMTLLTTPSILYFLSILFRHSVLSSALHSFFLTFESGVHNQSLVRYGIYPFSFLFFSLASLFTVAIRSLLDRRKRKNKEEETDSFTFVNLEEKSELFCQWNKLQQYLQE